MILRTCVPSAFTAIAAFLLAATCHASLLIQIPVPLDDPDAKFELWAESASAEQIDGDRSNYQAIEEQLRTLPESRLKDLFGASQEVLPAGYALPVHHHSGVGFSGLGYRGGERSYFLPIANLGGLLVFPLGDKDYVSALVIYLKTDAEFVALRTSADYLARRAWEVARTEALKKHIEQVLHR